MATDHDRIVTLQQAFTSHEIANEKAFKSLEDWQKEVERDYVRKSEWEPYRTIIAGLVIMILTGVLGAILVSIGLPKK